MSENITLIIPTYRNPKYLDLCLRSAVENRESPETQILVIVDGYFEESREVLEKYNDVLYLDLGENRGMQFAINAGVMQATNPYMFIINDDNVMPRHWDTRLKQAIQKAESDFGKHVVLTVDQIEPTGPGMFNFPVVDLGQDVESFNYVRFLDVEESMANDKPTIHDGHIFPFVVSKRFFMAVGGFDTFYNSPNVCDWDHMLKYELLDFDFPRTRALRLYHFGSVVTRKNSEAPIFMSKHAEAVEAYNWKWGSELYNEPGTNSKIPRNKKFRGFEV